MKKLFQGDCFNEPAPEGEEIEENKGGCFAALLGTVLIIALISLIMHLEPPGRKTCMECEQPISEGYFCEICDLRCKRCGMIAAEKKQGYCMNCFREVYSID